MNAISQRKRGFETRVANATEKRFDDRPQLMKLNVGDFFEYGVPVIEDAWRFDNGVRVTEQTEDVADPDLDLLGTDYPIRHQHRAWFATFISPEIGSAARVRQFVGRLGFKAYWPRSVRVVRRGKAKKEVVIVSQVYPRYVLVHLPARWEAAKREGAAVVRIADGSPVLEPHSVPFGLLTGHEARFNGLAGLVKFGKEPIWLPDALVERIVRRERAGSFNDTVRSGSKVLPKLPAWCFLGAIVKVVDGPFASFPAVIEALDLAKSRAQVSVNIFGRATPTDLAIADLSDVC